jgi:hypothetical protein
MKVICIKRIDECYKTNGIEKLLEIGKWYEVANDFSTQIMGSVIAQTHRSELVNFDSDYFIAIKIPSSGIGHYPKNWFQTMEQLRDDNINKILK